MMETSSAYSSRPCRVLIADDQLTYLAEMAELLRGAGYDCDCVADGHQCEQELMRGDVDVLVADLRMPGNLNLELVSRVRSFARAPAIILMTGYPTLESAIQSIKLKISAYLVKPFGFNELLTEVESAVAESRPATRTNSDVISTRPRASQQVDQQVDTKLFADHPEVQRLTKREFEVLVRVLMGDDVPAIGSALYISPHTVRNHLKAIYRKLDVRSRVELVVRFGPLVGTQALSAALN